MCALGVITLGYVESAFSSTALLVAIAAILWVVYLVPVWVKRSEYLATERNATRLGQTLRVLAETAEASPELRAELSARDVWRKSREAERSVTEYGLSDPEKKARRRRHLRIITTVFTALGLAGLLGAWLASAATWVIVATGAKVITGMVTLQVLASLAKPKNQQARVATVPPAANRRTQVNPRAWTPPPLPEPMSTRQTIPSQSEVLPSREELLRKARAAAQVARPQEAAAEAATLAPVSAFDQMGRVEPGTSATAPNLDEVLQRRRAV
jgi:hypothetical protein